MYGTFKTLVQNQWEAKKSPFKMEFYTEPQSQCGICDYSWFKNSERAQKVYLKWNSTLNRNLNVESVTTAGSKTVEGAKSPFKMELNRGTNFLWLTPKTAGLILLVIVVIIFYYYYHYNNYHYIKKKLF